MFTSGPLRVLFTERGRVKLLEDLTWQDADGTVTVPRGFTSDGVSAPAITWPFVGHPYAGTLVRAAILHDYEIWSRRADNDTVHRRFYAALRASGVGRVRAALLFSTVWLFGPRWEMPAA
jgi:hypothetical protein